MQWLMNFFGGLRTSALSPLIAFVLILGLVGQTSAQTSRYNIDDVMDKLIEMDRRLTVVERQIDTVNANLSARIDDTNTTMRWLFGFLGGLFLGILALTFAVYRNTAGLSKGILPKEAEKPGEDLARVLKTLEALQGEVKATAERERALEEKLQAAGVI